MSLKREQIRERPYGAQAVSQLAAGGMHPVLARICAARGVDRPEQMEVDLAGLLHYGTLKGIDAAAMRLAEAVMRQQRVLVVADYDADGATACAVAVRGLGLFGLKADYWVPNRFIHGYGLTPEIVRIACERQAELIVTVDNGIASIEGVQAAHAAGIEVLVTDHHLPGASLPDCLIVDPSQPGCAFPSKHLAGVGVMFYVLLATRRRLQLAGAFGTAAPPRLAALLDLVALGTVADVVRLDDNNRILVAQGLRRIREGRGCPGVRALFAAAGRNPATASAGDLGFSIGPRLNAAGRLDDMSLGIACLLSDDEAQAMSLASQLQQLNQERREIEDSMQQQAMAALPELEDAPGYSLVLFEPDWHAGVVGILASRLKERFHRPVICFARAGEGEIRGSGRSIAALHLRDALDRVANAHPGLIEKFGGHAAAAGLTLREARLTDFVAAFESAVRSMLVPEDLHPEILTDGSLQPEEMAPELAQAIHAQVWGQGFPMPQFVNSFRVLRQRVIRERHLKLVLGCGDRQFDAILFQCSDTLPERIEALYQLDWNQYQDQANVQLLIRDWCRTQ